VHHANLQAAALLARVGVRAGRDDFVALARRAAAAPAARQLPDGSWPHGEAPHLRWVDHFHAGSMVGSLAALCGTGLVAVAPVALERAVRRLLATHFDGDGQPRVAARPGGPLEADVLVAADAMDALGRFAALQPAVLPFVAAPGGVGVAPCPALEPVARASQPARPGAHRARPGTGTGPAARTAAAGWPVSCAGGRRRGCVPRFRKFGHDGATRGPGTGAGTAAGVLRMKPQEFQATCWSPRRATRPPASR
jgi:hypothetical protein